jgi:transcriptional regulator with XRE-family HTH domain
MPDPMAAFHAANTPSAYEGDAVEEPEFAASRSFCVIDTDNTSMWWDGDKLRALMAERGLSQPKLARMVGTTRQPTISNWVNGQTPSGHYVHKLVSVLRCDIKDLFTRDPTADVLASAFRNYSGQPAANGEADATRYVQAEADRLLGELILEIGVPKEELQAWCLSRGVDYERARECANLEHARRNGGY